MRRNSDINVAIDDDTLAMVDAIARLHGTSRAHVVRAAIAKFIKPVPATPALPATPPQAIEAPTPARAGSRPSARWCMPRVVPGGRRT